MRESLASTAQYTLNASADARGLLALRARVKRRANRIVNINDLVTFCTIEALLDVPALNAEFIDGGIREHADVHMGFACDTPRGLLVPVVRDAHTLAVDELAARMKELAAQAVDGTIAPGRPFRRHLHRQQSRRAWDRSLHAAAQSAAGRDSGRRRHPTEAGAARRPGRIHRRHRALAHLRSPGDRRRARREIPAGSEVQD